MRVTVVKTRTSGDGHTFAWGITAKNQIVTFLLRKRLSWVRREVREGEAVDVTVDPYSVIRVQRRRAA